ncbi:NUP62 [Lepeophtheirus salmonis]|uniref:NUP62 n=1 Tax=Lepeophtheirus salmonis TaxID=72036 RepID=A0A7R8GZD2_LEPSM|nr:NUP62 [Lepeophtheirus salmonis]CAF2751836.1 NUP62 [Lepeophtheirus salmonis]
MFSFGTPTTTASGTASTGFSFGTPATAASAGFSFGTPTAAPTAPATGFGLGTPTAAAATNPAVASPARGFGFGTPTGGGVTTAAAGGGTPGFMGGGPPAKAKTPTTAAGILGTPVQAQGTTSSSFSFSLGGTPTATSTTMPPASTAAPSSAFSFGLQSATPTTTATAPGLSFGAPATTKPPAFGVASAATTAAPSGFGITTASTTTAPAGFGITTASTTTAPAGFGITTASTTTPTVGFGIATAATTTPSSKRGLSFGTTVTATTAAASPSGFAFGTTPATTATTGLNFGKPAISASSTAPGTTTSASTLAATAPNATLSTTTTTTAASAASVSMNYRQLEEAINKWTLELEEQEKVFLNQATQVNAWDRLLISNGENIVTLNEQVEKVKLDQQRLEHELDFIKGQQSELEEILRPLESSLNTSDTSGPPPDTERERTYHLAETMDAQLQRMSEDLKEIIEHLNSANRHQDSNDPIVQIGRVLNAHMDSLQWIDQSTSQVQRKLDEVTKIYEIRKKDNERTTGIFEILLAQHQNFLSDFIPISQYFLICVSLAVLGPHHKTVEELLDGSGEVDDAPKTYIQGRCPEIITNGMEDMHAKVSEFMLGFENLQKGNNILLSQWEDTLEEVEVYSKKLRAMKETLDCRVTQFGRTLCTIWDFAGADNVPSSFLCAALFLSYFQQLCDIYPPSPRKTFSAQMRAIALETCQRHRISLIRALVLSVRWVSAICNFPGVYFILVLTSWGSPEIMTSCTSLDVSDRPIRFFVSARKTSIDSLVLHFPSVVVS